MTDEYAQKWYSEGMANNEGLPQIPSNRKFLFKGKNGQGGQMTTHEDITRWIMEMLPPPEKEAAVKEIDYEVYVEQAAGSGNIEM